jgi:extracellular elastinolytic metalloproteinase
LAVALCVAFVGAPTPQAAASASLTQRPLAPTVTQIRALARLQEAVPDLVVGWNARFGTPSSLHSHDGALTAPSITTPTQIATRWVKRHGALFGGAASVRDLRVVKTLTQPRGGPRIVLLHQRFGDLEGGGALGGSIVVTLDRAGRILLVRAAAARVTSLVSASRHLDGAAAFHVATGSVAKVIGERAGWTELKTPLSAATQYARAVAFPVGSGPARRAIELLVIRAPDDAESVVIDAITGKVLRRDSLVDYAQARVFRHYPGAPKGGAHDLRSVPAGWLFC